MPFHAPHLIYCSWFDLRRRQRFRLLSSWPVLYAIHCQANGALLSFIFMIEWACAFILIFISQQSFQAELRLALVPDDRGILKEPCFSEGRFSHTLSIRAACRLLHFGHHLAPAYLTPLAGHDTALQCKMARRRRGRLSSMCRFRDTYFIYYVASVRLYIFPNFPRFIAIFTARAH